MEEEQVITPWNVEASKSRNIDYKKIVDSFGCQEIDKSLIDKIEDATGKKAHFFLKRKIAFAHRDLDKVIGKSFYLYTGRGPSSSSMHLGHVIPFIFCKYLQEAFDVPLVIQITDDEKFLWKELELDQSIKYGLENIKDIIALGFDPKKTFIFSNFEYSHKFHSNTIKISKSINLNEAMKIFGFDKNHNIGQIDFPSKEIAPCFSSSFDFLDKNLKCLIPAAIDQDPYFRLARDKSHILNSSKPSTIYLSFLPGLKGVNTKMSSSDNLSSIYLNDSPKDVEEKIKKIAFSGGKDTAKEHRASGGNTEVDISFQYLRFFLESDEEFEKIEKEYRTGRMLTSELKKICIGVIQNFLEKYQSRRKNISDEDILFYKKPLHSRK